MYGLGDTPSGRLYKQYFLVNFGVFELLYSVHCISFNIGLARVVQMLDSAIHPINIGEAICAIQWIEIYPMDSIILLLNNLGLI